MTIDQVDTVGKCIALLGLLMALGAVLTRMNVLSWTRPLAKAKKKKAKKKAATTSEAAKRAQARVLSAAARGFMESAEERRLRSFLEGAVPTRKEASEPKARLEGLRTRASEARRVIGLGLLEAGEASESPLPAERTEALGSARPTAFVGKRRRVDLSEVALAGPLFSPEAPEATELERASQGAAVAFEALGDPEDLDVALASPDESSAAWVSFERAAKTEASSPTAATAEGSSESSSRDAAEAPPARAEPTYSEALASTGIGASGVAVTGPLPRLTEGSHLAILNGDAESCLEEIEELWLEAQYLHTHPDRQRAARMAAELRRLADTYLLLAHAPECVPEELLLPNPSHTEIAA